MATPHIGAPEGAFAKTVLMPGDPLRAKKLAETYLENPVLVTSVRNILGYTGTYKGKRVSVMASGIGMPSIGIYSHELYTHYGVETIVRIGSAGGYTADLHLQDVVLADSAYSGTSYAMEMNHTPGDIMYPTADLNRHIIATAERLGLDLKVCRIHSSDVFYSEDAAKQKAKDAGAECVEMEAFALFHNAQVLGKRAACLLTISDSFVYPEILTAEERQNTFHNMMQIALESAEQ